MWEGRRAEANTFYIASDLNVELGLLCTDEDEVEELNEMKSPLCWQGCDTDQGGFKKLMWYEIMKEFNCRVTSSWSSCDREKEMAFTQTFWDRCEWKDDAAGLHHQIWDTWNHYPIYVSIHEDDAHNYFLQKKNTWAGWRPVDDEAKSEFKKIMMSKNVRSIIKKTWRQHRRTFERAHTTKSDRVKEVRRTPQEVRIREEAAARCTKMTNRRVLKKQARKARTNHLVKCSMMPGKKRLQRKPLTELYVNGKLTEDREEWIQEL